MADTPPPAGDASRRRGLSDRQRSGSVLRRWELVLLAVGVVVVIVAIVTQAG